MENFRSFVAHAAERVASSPALAAAATAVGALWALRTAIRGRRGDLDDMPQASGEWPFPIGCVPRLLKLGNHEFLRQIHIESGPIVHMNLGAMDVVSVADPDVARAILSKPDTFVPGERLVWQYFRPLADGLIMLSGEQWRRERNVLSPAFHQDALQAMTDIFVEHVATALEVWGRMPLVNFSQEFAKLTVDVICHAALGQPAGALRRQSDFTEALDAVMDEVQRRMTEPVQVWRAVRTGRQCRFEANVRRLQQHADRFLEERLALPEQRPDMLGAMIAAYRAGGLSRGALRHEALMVMVAGNETSAITLTFCAHLLASHPDMQERCRQEARAAIKGTFPTLDELERMPFLTAFIKESLRLYPAGYVVFRAVDKEASVGGYTLPRGTQIFICVYAIHRDPNIWGEDADEFRPERFMNATGGEDKKAFMPFSWGIKLCPGRHLSMAEIRFALAALLVRYRLEFPPGTPHDRLPAGRVTFALRPRDDVVLRMVPLDAALAGKQ